jgi:hypothetical protein
MSTEEVEFIDEPGVWRDDKDINHTGTFLTVESIETLRVGIARMAKEAETPISVDPVRVVIGNTLPRHPAVGAQRKLFQSHNTTPSVRQHVGIGNFHKVLTNLCGLIGI